MKRKVRKSLRKAGRWAARAAGLIVVQAIGDSFGALLRRGTRKAVDELGVPNPLPGKRKKKKPTPERE